MTRRTFAIVGTVVVVAGAVGYWTVVRLAPHIQPDVARAANILGTDPAKLQEATDLVDRIQSSKSLQGNDRKQVDALLASDVPTYRRYGVKALQFGLARTNPEEVEKVCAGMLRDADEHVRATAAMTLYQVAPDHWARYSAQVAADGSRGVQAVASLVAAQQRSGGESLGQK